MTRTEYDNLPAINFSYLKYYLKSPLHFLHAWTNRTMDEEETKALLIGRAIHLYVLELEKFDKQYTFLDFEKRPVKFGKTGAVADYKTKENREWRDETIQAMKLAGKTVLPSKADLDMIVAMGASISHHPAASKLLHECVNETFIEWTDKDTGVKCKAQIDFCEPVKKFLVGDLKSMEDASPNGVSKFMQKWLSHMQLAFYSDGLAEIYGLPFNSAFIIAVEKQLPYISQPYFLDELDIEVGRKMYKKLLALHAKCVAENKWGSYDAVHENYLGVITARLPEYVRMQSEMEN